jgi:hypothetical protein
VFTATFACAGINAPTGYYFSEEDWTIQDNTFAGGLPGTNSVQFTYSVGGTFSGTTLLTTTVTGSAQGATGTETGNGTCVAGVDGSVGWDCESTGTFNSSTTTLAAFSVTATSSWLSGGLNANGIDQVNLYYSYTLSPIVTTPEPASLLMIGGGLIGLASLIRRKKKA